MNSHLTKLFLFILCATSYLTIQSMGVITCRTIKSENLFVELYNSYNRKWLHKLGNIVATSNNYLVAICDNDICVWDLRKGQLLYRIPYTKNFGLSPENIIVALGKIIVTDTLPTSIKIWKLSDGSFLCKFNTPLIKSLKVIGHKIIIFGNTSTSVWNFDGQCLFTIPDVITSKIIGDKIVAIKNDKTVELWTLTGSRINRFADCTNEINAIAIDNENIVYASQDDTVKIRNLNNGNLLYTIVNHTPSPITRIETACNKIITQAPLITRIWNFDGKYLTTAFGPRDYTSVGDRLLLMGGCFLSCINLNDCQLVDGLKRCPTQVSEIVDGKIIVKSLNDSMEDSINIFRLSDCKLLHTLPNIAADTEYIGPFIAAENKIIAMPNRHTLKIYTDTRPAASSYTALFTLAGALHPRCGQDSPANVLTSYLLQKISRYVIPEPWAESPNPLEIREVPDEEPAANRWTSYAVF